MKVPYWYGSVGLYARIDSLGLYVRNLKFEFEISNFEFEKWSLSLFSKMCLAIPARVIRIEGNLAQVDMAGARKEADIRMVKDVKVGEYILIHAGFAIEKVRKKEAEETLRLFREMG